MKNEIELATFDDLVYVDSEDLLAATGLDIDDDGNLYDPLAKDLDNDDIPDRYDNNFRDSDYLESNFDVEDNLNTKDTPKAKEEKTSILNKLKVLKTEDKLQDSKYNKDKGIDER